jgi:DNA-binding NtrC family response regulator
MELKVAIPTIIMAGQGDVPTAVRAMKAGAFDFLESLLTTGSCSVQSMPRSTFKAGQRTADGFDRQGEIISDVVARDRQDNTIGRFHSSRKAPIFLSAVVLPIMSNCVSRRQTVSKAI